MSQIVTDLIERTAEKRLRIAVIGDAMLDVWVPGEQGFGQESCLLFRADGSTCTPGGAANAARQFQNWNVDAFLISPLSMAAQFSKINTSLSFPCDKMPVKIRYVAPDGKVVFRCDWADSYEPADMKDRLWAQRVLDTIRQGAFDAVLLADYDKGFLDDKSIENICNLCYSLEIPLVVDGKRRPEIYPGALLKGNRAYGDRYPCSVVTDGAMPPLVHGNRIPWLSPEVPCRNHIGAGDCFGAHLALATACGMTLNDAAAVAHAAGRVFVQHDYGRAPWPHEIARDLDHASGKLVAPGQEYLAALRSSIPGKIVFTNGVFRVPHAGHVWLLRWAKSCGHTLVVALNDDESAKIAKGPENFVLPVEERAEWLCGLECVDWVVPFPWSDPIEIIQHLKPDILVKGHEYSGRRIPGDTMVGEVLIAPPDAYPRHCTDLVDEVKKK